jgi:HSP20 family protein
MFPGRRKRDWNLEDDFFRGLDEEFKEMEEHIARMFSEMGGGSPEHDEESGPYIYGFPMRMGPEGKARIEEFGNIPSMISQRTETPGEREPLTDIIEGDKEISVVIELPGIEKKDINLNVAVDSLEIDVDTPERQYHKKLALPCEVRPKKTRATYKNGVLEVKIERVAEKEEMRGARVEVE